ncbi:hypothetical protein BCR44DRAFT_1110968 [Catenaria anguillulae PL171]|uniref:Uncharacterized protein n=1 Tax=Catenaria anguillulae PL171 TaxID=765915 RepID=A0A1Y2HMU1_9FUNG|nr:hypothetical protein BCR44DRAFT_1110968 [Catenaria anguillulae PL171]
MTTMREYKGGLLDEGYSMNVVACLYLLSVRLCTRKCILVRSRQGTKCVHSPRYSNTVSPLTIQDKSAHQNTPNPIFKLGCTYTEWWSLNDGKHVGSIHDQNTRQLMVNNGHKSWLIGDITNQLGIHNRSRRFHIESGLGILLRLLLCL